MFLSYSVDAPAAYCGTIRALSALHQHQEATAATALFESRVKELRIANGLTQADVAEKHNVTPGFFSNVEKGRSAMSLRLLIYYAQLTGCTLDMLVGEMVPDYRATALDHELQSAVANLTEEQKKGACNTQNPRRLALVAKNERAVYRLIHRPYLTYITQLCRRSSRRELNSVSRKIRAKSYDILRYFMAFRAKSV